MIGILSGFLEDGTLVEVIFESYYKPSGIENTISFANGLVSVSQTADGGTSVNVAGIQLGDKPQEPEIKVMTFDDFQRESSGRWATHEIIGQKSKLEFVGPGLEDLSFSILLNVSLGVNPEEELVKLRQIRDEGITCILMIGDEPITDNLVVIEKLSEAHKTFDGKGKLTVASVNISLKEYVE